MNTCWNLWAKAVRLVIPGILFFLVGPSVLRAQFQVDCSGANPNAYPSINAALNNAGPGAFILVTGTCNESVVLWGRNGLNLGAYNGQTATINGNITINNSQNVFLFGFNVTNAGGDGIDVGSSRGINLDSCNSSGNAGDGLNVGGLSDVTISAQGTFDHNGNAGLAIGGGSAVNAYAWGGKLNISNNTGPGIFIGSAQFATFGNTTISNNTVGGFSSGYGVDLRGAGKAQFGAIYGPNVLTGNQSGGAWLQENSEISFWFGGQQNIIQGNGPVGVLAGLGSQVTFFNSAQISGHSSAAVDLYANSQAYFFGANTVQGNGSSTDARSAGIVVDGNSEAFLRGGQISGNTGPALLALVNSSVDFAGVSFSGNGRVISCDSSSVMVSDLTRPESTPAEGVVCRMPHALGGRHVAKTPPQVPDWSEYKAQHDRYAQLAVKH
jgi:hypothetical protein